MKRKTACFLGKIAIHLGFVSRFIEAKDCAFDAVLMWRSLVVENPDSHTPDLAHELGSLGVQLSNLNRHEESLDAIQKSITQYQLLVGKNALYTPHLARQLGNLGVQLSKLNRHEDSLRAIKEAVSLYRSA